MRPRLVLSCAAVLAAGACRENIVLPPAHPHPPPVLQSISPSEAYAGSGGLTLTAHGADFSDSSVVLVDGQVRPTRFVSPSTLMATLSRGDVAASGTFHVVVYTPPPGGGTSDTATLTLVLNVSGADTAAFPVVAYLVPAMAVRGEPPFDVAVYGSGFTPRTLALVNGAVRPTNLVKASKLYITVAAADLAAEGSLDISVVTPPPGGGTAAPHPFAVVAPAAGRPREWNVSAVPLGPGVTWAAIASTGLAYVSRAGTDSIAVVDLPLAALSASFWFGGAPGEIVFDWAGATAYVVDQDHQAVGVVVTATRRRVASWPLAAAPLGVRLGPGDARLYVPLADGTLAVLDAATGASVASLPLGASATALALTPDRARLWVATAAGTVHEVATGTNLVGRTLIPDGAPRDVAVSPDGALLFVTTDQGTVEFYDAASLAPAGAVAVAHASSSGVTPDGTQLWVVREADGRVSVVDVARRSVSGVAYTTGAPRHIVFQRDGAAALVTNAIGAAQIIR